ncbi:cytochrome b [Sedimenticola sp.]|uniref:cytochrome b n=1 Tax=Sedimenticola sp. TaxID=1940285 RepID=UPI003D0F9EAE
MAPTQHQTRWALDILLLHWGMALLIVGMMVVGWIARTLPLSPLKIELFFWHKSFGVALLALTLLRLARRLRHPHPGWPVAMPRWERRAARAVHGLLYTLMFVTPLSGWVINSAAKFPFKVFGVWTLPAIVAADKSIQHLAEQVHMGCFILFFSTLLLHIAAALRHHFILHDTVLRRMLPEGFTTMTQNKNLDT